MDYNFNGPYGFQWQNNPYMQNGYPMGPSQIPPSGYNSQMPPNMFNNPQQPMTFNNPALFTSPRFNNGVFPFGSQYPNQNGSNQQNVMPWNYNYQPLQPQGNNLKDLKKEQTDKKSDTDTDSNEESEAKLNKKIAKKVSSLLSDPTLLKTAMSCIKNTSTNNVSGPKIETESGSDTDLEKDGNSSDSTLVGSEVSALSGQRSEVSTPATVTSESSVSLPELSMEKNSL